MDNLTRLPNNSLDGFSENMLLTAYENIFENSNQFYSLLYNKFIDQRGIELDHMISVPHTSPYSPMNNNVKTILLADDDEDDCNFFKEALQEIDSSTKTIIVHDGAELMQYLIGNGHRLPQMIFLDLNLPKKNGLECLANIRSDDLLKSIPIAIYSTSAAAEDIRESYLLGANIYVKKPDNFSVIKKILDEVISVNWVLQLRSTDTYFVNGM